MAASPRASGKRVNGAAAVWAAMAAALFIASALMLGSLFFGQDYRQEALDQSQRIEFSLEYDSQGNAQLGGLKGEPLDLQTAQSMAALAQQNQPEEAEHVAEEHPAEMPEEALPEEALSEEAASPSDSEQAPAHDTPAHDTPAPDAGETAGEAATQEAAPTASDAPANEQPQPEAEQAAEEAPAETQAKAPPAEPAIVLAPVEEQTEQGILPVISSEGTAPWRYFAKRDYARPGDKPRIAVVVSGLGLAASSTQDAIALPDAVTLAFSPYGREITAAMAEQARSAGHEILLDLPMETPRFPAIDPGPFGLRNDLETQENMARLTTVLGKARGFVGLMGTVRDSISDRETPIVPLIRALEKRGLLFVSAHSQPPAGMFRIQRRASVPVLLTDVILDERITDTAIKNQMARAEDHARTHGKALVLGQSYPLTIDLLAAWLPSLQSKGFALVPVSALGEDHVR